MVAKDWGEGEMGNNYLIDIGFEHGRQRKGLELNRSVAAQHWECTKYH